MTSPIEKAIKDAESAIDLFLEYRDKHGHNEESAKAHALNEFAEAEALTTPVRGCNCYVLPHDPECSIFVGITQSGERVEERRSGQDRRSSFVGEVNELLAAVGADSRGPGGAPDRSVGDAPGDPGPPFR